MGGGAWLVMESLKRSNICSECSPMGRKIMIIVAIVMIIAIIIMFIELLIVMQSD